MRLLQALFTSSKRTEEPTNHKQLAIVPFDKHAYGDHVNCHHLTAPFWEQERGLQDGLWVVFWYAPGSPSSALSWPTVFKTAQQENESIQFGIHSVEYGKERLFLNFWCPLLEEPEYRDPVWLFFRNGKLQGHTVGILSPKQLQDRIKSFLLSE